MLFWGKHPIPVLLSLLYTLLAKILEEARCRLLIPVPENPKGSDTGRNAELQGKSSLNQKPGRFTPKP